MWPFNKKTEINEEEIVDNAIDELDCHKHYDAYVDCLLNSKFSYKGCLEIMETYRYCLASAYQKAGQKDKKFFMKSIK